jgi:hypothetical protein
MRARTALMAAACLASSCSGKGEFIPTPSPEPIPQTTAPDLISALPAPDPATTMAPTTTSTTQAPEEVVAPTTTLPVLCPHLPHPLHHDYCPVATTVGSELRKQTPTQPSSSSSTALPYNGWAIPEYIVSCETGGTFDWMAYNASGASGPYQLMPLHFGGELAMHQSRAAQHAKAAELWNGGKGKSHWSACL